MLHLSKIILKIDIGHFEIGFCQNVLNFWNIIDLFTDCVNKLCKSQIMWPVSVYLVKCCFSAHIKIESNVLARYE